MNESSVSHSAFKCGSELTISFFLRSSSLLINHRCITHSNRNHSNRIIHEQFICGNVCYEWLIKQFCRLAFKDRYNEEGNGEIDKDNMVEKSTNEQIAKPTEWINLLFCYSNTQIYWPSVSPCPIDLITSVPFGIFPLKKKETKECKSQNFKINIRNIYSFFLLFILQGRYKRYLQ